MFIQLMHMFCAQSIPMHTISSVCFSSTNFTLFFHFITFRLYLSVAGKHCFTPYALQAVSISALLISLYTFLTNVRLGTGLQASPVSLDKSKHPLDKCGSHSFRWLQKAMLIPTTWGQFLKFAFNR